MSILCFFLPQQHTKHVNESQASTQHTRKTILHKPHPTQPSSHPNASKQRPVQNAQPIVPTTPVQPSTINPSSSALNHLKRTKMKLHLYCY